MLILSVLLVIILSGLSFLGGMIMPLGVVFIVPSAFFGFIFTVNFIVISVKKRKLNVFVFFLLPIMFSGIMGYKYDRTRTETTKIEIMKIKKYIEKYYEEYGKLPSEDDEYYQNKRVRVDDLGNGEFVLYYKDAITKNGEDRVNFRSRP